MEQHPHYSEFKLLVKHNQASSLKAKKKKNVYLVIVCEHPDKVGRNLNGCRLPQLNPTNHKQNELLYLILT